MPINQTIGKAIPIICNIKARTAHGLLSALSNIKIPMIAPIKRKLNLLQFFVLTPYCFNA